MKRLLAILAVFCVLGVATANAAVVFEVKADNPNTSGYDGDYLTFVASAYGNASGFTRKYPDGSGNSLQGGSPGGEFKFLVTPTYPSGTYDDTANYLVTFCAQIGEFIDYGMVYKVGSITTNVNDFAKWIFWGYTSNNESSNIVPDRVSSGTQYVDTPAEAKKIQGALWTALGYGGYVDTGWITSDEYDDWLDAYNADKTAGNWPPTGTDSGVAVLLKAAGGGAAQDQWVLVRTPVGGVIPEPASVAIWSLIGVTFAFGLRVVRRRRSSPAPSGWTAENRQAIREVIERGRRC